MHRITRLASQLLPRTLTRTHTHTRALTHARTLTLSRTRPPTGASFPSRRTMPVPTRGIPSLSAAFSSAHTPQIQGEYTFRVPSKESKDHLSMHKIADDSGVLEVNTPYCYLAFCHHFAADGCIVAERENNVVGYVQGYRPPTHRNAVFVWQIGVTASERGRKLGVKLLAQLARRVAADGVDHLEATVTPSNIPSRKLFRSFARAVGAECVESPLFLEHHFPEPKDGEHAHEPEDLFRIGPFTEQACAAACESL